MRASATVLGLVVLLAVVALAAGGGTSLRGEPAELTTPQLVVDYVYSLLVVLVVLALVAFVALVLMSRGGKLPQRPGRGTGILFFVAFLGIAVLGSRVLDRQTPAGGDEGVVRIPQFEQPQEPLAGERRQQLDDPAFRWEVVAAVVGAGAVAALLLARRRAEEPADDPHLGAATAVSGVLDEALDDLRTEADARRAVIAAYARLEATLAHYGLPRRPAEAPLEYLSRVLLELHVRPAAVLDLTELFEQAKFSARRIDQAMKHEAIDALVAVRDDLRAAA